MTRTRTFPLPRDYREILATLRSLRGTAHYRPVLLLLHELRLERQHRRRVERLRVDQSARLFVATQELAVVGVPSKGTPCHDGERR